MFSVRSQPRCVYATEIVMASGKKSALLSSLADYGDDSEPDSDPEPEDSGDLKKKKIITAALITIKHNIHLLILSVRLP